MIAHIPMFAHPNPEHVLVVGGGDGGVLREVMKHPSVKSVTICEIDQMVMDVSKKYFPTISHVWSDKRLKVLCQDASVYMESKEAEGAYDVIICDSSDPDGPAHVLFESKFYKAMHKALKPGGRISTQAEAWWNYSELIAKLFRGTLSTFACVEYAMSQIPTYPCGVCGFLVCTKASTPVAAAAATDAKSAAAVAAAPTDTCSKPSRPIPAGMSFGYYHPDLHSASFVLPLPIKKIIEQVREEYATAKKAAGTPPVKASTATAAATSTAAGSGAPDPPL